MPVAGGHHPARQHAVLRRVLGLHPAAAVALLVRHGRGTFLNLVCTRPSTAFANSAYQCLWHAAPAVPPVLPAAFCAGGNRRFVAAASPHSVAGTRTVPLQGKGERFPSATALHSTAGCLQLADVRRPRQQVQSPACQPRALLQGYAVLGLGDIALPGVLAAMCRCFDAAAAYGKRPAWRGHFPLAVAAYAAGLLLTYTALMLSWFGDQGQVRGTVCRHALSLVRCRTISCFMSILSQLHICPSSNTLRLISDQHGCLSAAGATVDRALHADDSSGVSMAPRRAGTDVAWVGGCLCRIWR
jgi:Signal peptide peptidase